MKFQRDLFHDVVFYVSRWHYIAHLVGNIVPSGGNNPQDVIKNRVNYMNSYEMSESYEFV